MLNPENKSKRKLVAVVAINLAFVFIEEKVLFLLN